MNTSRVLLTSYRAEAPLSLLLCSTPVHGHVTPLLSVARALVAAGHDVRFLTGARYRTAVEATGARWVALPPTVDFDDTAIDAAFPERVGLQGVEGAKWDLQNIFLRPAPAQLAAIDDQVAASPVDAVLAESLFLGVMLLLARPRAERPPVINLGIVPLGLRSRETAPFALGIPPRAGVLGRIRNALLHTVTERIIFRDLQRAAEAMTIQTVGHPLQTAAMNYPATADAVVQFSVPAFEYPRNDLTVPVHFVGPVSLATASDAPLPQWWSDLDGKTVVHVTQGTVANLDLEDLILPTGRALADRDVIVVATTGGRPIPPNVQLPANMRIAEYLPYDQLLPRLSAFVTNGGYGGVHYALAHGVPVIVTGNTEDKAEVAARIAWSGAGIRLKPGRNGLDEQMIASAVNDVLTTASYRQNCARIGAEIAAASGPSGIAAILRDLIAVSAR